MKMTVARRVLYGSILVAVIAGLAYVIASGASTHWAAAGRIKDPDELRSAVKALEGRGIVARMTEGDSVEVHEDKLGEARMVLMAFAEDSGAEVGMELFDKSTFGQSARQEQINYVRALEGELARSIRTIDAVRSARVHLAIPERTVFIREEKKPTASVTLTLKAGQGLDKKQVRAVQRLVANAIPGMQRDGVVLVSDDGTMLSEADDSGVQGAFELKTQIERESEQKLIAMLERIVGVGKARVQVAALMDFSQVTENVTEIDPERQAVKSEKSGEESSVTDEPTAEGTAGVAGNDPARTNPAAARPKSSKNKKSEEREYENAVTRRTVVNGGARVKQLSVSVVVDGEWAKNEAGESVWKPRSADQLEQIKQAVKVGTGLDDARGDQVSVVSLKFEDVDGAPEAVAGPPPWIDLVRWGVGLLVALAFVFGIVRPTIQLMRQRPDVLTAGPTLALADGSMDGGLGGLPQLDAPRRDGRNGETGDSGEPTDAELEETMAKLEEAKRAADAAKEPVLTLGEQLRLQAIEATKANPDRAVQVVRAWLSREK